LANGQIDFRQEDTAIEENEEEQLDDSHREDTREVFLSNNSS
jgi:hypothetical protein|tara:strand:+ start:500 stop:625 length:126 start_codon:yes stop_codon:yes gene_type:complete